ncbi:spore germination protein [Clostridium thermarum]|uniref:spore germination protein n=1 Tax=Clostridium thermarum TaxID=1716543 RepID=UPI0011203E75|nr:spore germination protein [Clostridium thermarum]
MNDTNGQISSQNIESGGIPSAVSEVRSRLSLIFSENDDLTFREIRTVDSNRINILIVFISGLVNQNLINTDIIKPIQSMIYDPNDNSLNVSILSQLKESIISSNNIVEIQTEKDCIKMLLSGSAVIFIDGETTALSTSVSEFQGRNVEEPSVDSVLRGPREGFTESLSTNKALLRKKIKDSSLKFENIVIGNRTNTDICISYMKGIAHEDIIETVRNRLKNIQTDAILESGYLEEFIGDSSFSFLPLIGNTEKPDIVAAKILEGRVAIFCDGTPFVLTVPFLFIEGLQSSEDYYSKFYQGSISRLLRFLALFISAVLPASYVALTTFHQDIIPSQLLLTMAASREGIPFPPFLESLLIIITFELLREAGVRMPKRIGQAISIVGALVIGESAVKAGIMSNPMVIVIALTAICSFINPLYTNVTLILRVILLIGANILGFMGIMLIIFALYIHMCSLKSFGIPYMTPFSPVSGMDLKDSLIRIPIWAMLTRPKLLTWEKNKNTKFKTKANINKKEE